MTLNALLQLLQQPEYSKLDLFSDHRLIKGRGIFLALPGINKHGATFINAAIDNGAQLIIVDPTDIDISTIKINDKIIIFPELHLHLGTLAKSYYFSKITLPKIIAVTGTNGKTTVTHFIAELLNFAGKKCGIIGTLGHGFIHKLTQGNLTTPDCLSLYKNLYQLALQGAEYVALEATSHALMQQRLQGLHFDTVVFTNLSVDHLDYHKNLEEYFQAKLKLFTEYSYRKAITNLDDAYGAKLAKYLLAANKNVLGFYLNEISTDLKELTKITMKQLELTSTSVSGTLIINNNKYWLKAPITGIYSAQNILAALGVVIDLIGIKAIMYAKNISNVPGRMLQLPVMPQVPKVIVDFAHTPHALENLLQNLKRLYGGKIYIVFGCGGNRDPSKRALMGEVASKIADVVILTQDNPRLEDPMQIINAILSGCAGSANVFVELQRSAAIEKAIFMAQATDCVVIAGKGHEKFQIIGSKQLPFCDATTAKATMLLKSTAKC